MPVPRNTAGGVQRDSPGLVQNCSNSLCALSRKNFAEYCSFAMARIGRSPLPSTRCVAYAGTGSTGTRP